METDHLVFVYGTLRQGCRADYRLATADFVGLASLVGELYYIDRYPGLIDGEGSVTGEIYRVDEPLLRRLDDYEGCFCDPPDYKRESRSLTLPDGSQVQAFVYVFQLKNSLGYRIPGDDWAQHMRRFPELNS